MSQSQQRPVSSYCDKCNNTGWIATSFGQANIPCTKCNPKPVSTTWSESICKKIPERHWKTCFVSAIWILRNPVRLTPLEKEEVLTVIQNHRAAGRFDPS